MGRGEVLITKWLLPLIDSNSSIVQHHLCKARFAAFYSPAAAMLVSSLALPSKDTHVGDPSCVNQETVPGSPSHIYMAV